MQELEHGPSTAGELAALLELPMRPVSAYLAYLRSLGVVQVIGKMPTRTHKSQIYALVCMTRTSVCCSDIRCQRHARDARAI